MPKHILYTLLLILSSFAYAHLHLLAHVGAEEHPLNRLGACSVMQSMLCVQWLQVRMQALTAW